MRISTILAIVLILGFVGLSYMHEQTHVSIFRGYGIDSHIEYFSHFPSLVTIPDSPCLVEECELAHNITDSISYPLVVFYVVFGVMLLQIVCSLESLLLIKLEEKTNG
jgi:hypothetical protein